ncbi:MAG: histidinol dehydrogenase [Rickettsiales bacterium]|nr:histidinol dehydrogenase [Rickettsiales bacterium]|tara:strand:+ start:1852 stop:3126 length:1275 start_codon:yes stop_codon:yes gene_type:complete
MLAITIYNFDTKKRDQILDNNQESITKVVTTIGETVRRQRDEAIITYTKQFDATKADDSFSLLVTQPEIDDAYTQVTPAFKEAMLLAKKNITAFHSEQQPQNWQKPCSVGSYGMQYNPIEIVGLYVPGGQALYPSSVLMNAIPAKIAGVSQLIMTTPPRIDGSLAPEIIVAAIECGINKIIKAGGAQAIYGLAYGTTSIPAVDKIVGPGNRYVDTAKQAVYGLVDIDKPAGPSEVCVYIDNINYAAYAAAELFAQCEHDEDASGVIISDQESVLKAVQSELTKQFSHLKRQSIIKQALSNSALYHTQSSDEAIAIMNDIASEHLCLISDNAESIRPKIKHAGAIFCGPYTPVALGDYIAGPNHVLPTARAARFSSALSVFDFVKFSSILTASKESLRDVQPALDTLTSIESLDAHNNSISLRLS